MKKSGFRAVILAAGFGTRLRPLTLSLPKPLLPVTGLPVLAHTLRALASAGCEAVAVNLHHQGEKIAARFGPEFDGMPIRYSRETSIQGTLGALTALRSFLREREDAVVVNGDSLSRWPFAKLLRHHRQHRPKATVMVSSRARVEDYGGGIGLTRKGRVTSFRPDAPSERARPAEATDEFTEARRGVFAGAHVLCTKLLEDVAEGPSDLITDLYEPLVAGGGQIDAVESNELWFDLGTPRRYLDGVLGWAGRGKLGRRGWTSSEAELSSKASVKSSVIEAGVSVGDDARIRRSLVMSGTTVGAGCRVTDSIIGSSVELSPGTMVENRLVTAARADTKPSEGASIVGGLVYARLDR